MPLWQGVEMPLCHLSYLVFVFSKSTNFISVFKVQECLGLYMLGKPGTYITFFLTFEQRPAFETGTCHNPVPPF